LSDAHKEAIDRLKNYEHKIVWLNLLAEDAAKEIVEDLDFVYIDGNHAYDFVKQDINNYWPKLKSGGILGGHDFYNGFCREHDGVVKAVSEFSVQNCLSLQVELPDWWIRKP
jgi:predicted O-methyltransferase YrrM